MTRDIVQKIMEKKPNLFGHICRMSDDRLLKQVVLGIMDGTNRRGRRRRCTDDVEEWCSNDLYTLSTMTTGGME